MFNISDLWRAYRSFICTVLHWGNRYCGFANELHRPNNPRTICYAHWLVFISCGYWCVQASVGYRFSVSRIWKIIDITHFLKTYVKYWDRTALYTSRLLSEKKITNTICSSYSYREFSGWITPSPLNIKKNSQQYWVLRQFRRILV